MRQSLRQRQDIRACRFTAVRCTRPHKRCTPRKGGVVATQQDTGEHRRLDPPGGKILYVHIGTHKTATTSFQRFIEKHTTFLRGDGFLVPRSGTEHGYGGHHGIPWTLTGDHRQPHDRDAVKDLLKELEITDCSRALISSEDFQHLADLPEKLRLFQQAIEAIAWTPRFMICLRSQGAYTSSLYGMLNEQGSSQSKARFWWRAITTGKLVPAHPCFDLHYRRLLRRWALLTAAPVTIIVYQDQVLPSLLEATGINLSSPIGEQALKETRHNTRRRRPIPWYARLAIKLIDLRWRSVRPERLDSTRTAVR